MPLIVRTSPKPEPCRIRCAYRKGSGFVPCDSLEKAQGEPWDAMVAFMLEAPGAWEGSYGWPLVGNTGRFTFEEFVEPLGYTRADVFIDNVIRCQPPRSMRDGRQAYPTGRDRVAAESACRYWDAALDLWRPSLVSCTWHPASLFEDRSKTRMVAEVIRKAFQHAEAGYRPLVLFGDHARYVFAPHLQGDTKRWQGHWWPVDWTAQGGGAEALTHIAKHNRPKLEDVRT